MNSLFRSGEYPRIAVSDLILLNRVYTSFDVASI